MAGLLGSLHTANSGLHAAAAGISVTGDNIANVNTTGFKGSRAHFQDLLSEFVVGASGPNQIGRGVTLERIEKLFTQGSVQHTGVPTDMAINGDGFFILSGTAIGGATENLFTRNGAFRFDENGVLISQGGHRVQGFTADPTGQLNAAQGDIAITRRNLEPRATENIRLNANLRPDDPEFPGGFDVNDPENTSSYRTTMVVYDGQGNGHEVTVYGTRTGPNQWDFNAVADPASFGPAGANPIPIGQLEFDANGRLLDANIADPVTFEWTTGPSDVSFDLGDPINAGGTGVAGTSQWNQVSESATHFINQDGYGTGSLQGISIDQNGLISGGFSNGQTLVLGQVALARFEDPTGLGAIGANNFVQTASSGEANIGTALTGGRGGIMSAALEGSNIELSDQFIDLIAYQRAFQANSRTIQTADGMLQEVFNLLR